MYQHFLFYISSLNSRILTSDLSSAVTQIRKLYVGVNKSWDNQLVKDYDEFSPRTLVFTYSIPTTMRKIPTNFGRCEKHGQVLSLTETDKLGRF